MTELLFKTEGYVHSDIPEKFSSRIEYELTQDCSSLCFKFFSGEKPLYFQASDPEGRIRIQVLSKHKVKSSVLYSDENKTGPGTCPGKISTGKWLITAYAFGARCTGGPGKTDFTVEIYKGNNQGPEEKYADWIDRSAFADNRIALGSFEKTAGRILSESCPQEFRDPGKIEKCENSWSCSWLKGDFHAHTNLSDGSASPSELLDEGVSNNLDFFFISEHGILPVSFPEKFGIEVYPSFEITTCSGHLNLHGLRYIPENLHSLGPDPEWSSLEDILSEAGKSGALVSVNHPMLYPWQWLYNEIPLSMIDAVEVITDPYAFGDGAPGANEKALALLDIMWNSGYRIAGIGGSDTHSDYSDSRLGQPVTQVYAVPGSMKSILTAVKNCRAAVFTDLECTFYYRINGKKVLPGTGIENFGDIDFEIRFDPGNYSEVFFLRIVENGIPVKEIKTVPGEAASASVKWEGSSDWIRCEIRDEKNMIRGFVNPVYRKNRNSSSKKISTQKKSVLTVSVSPDSSGSTVSVENIKTWGDAAALLG